MKVGVREFRNNLSKYLMCTQDIEITSHGNVIKVLCVHKGAVKEPSVHKEAIECVHKDQPTVQVKAGKTTVNQAMYDKLVKMVGRVKALEMSTTTL